MPSSACSRHHRALHSFPTRRSSDLLRRVEPEQPDLLIARQLVPERLPQPSGGDDPVRPSRLQLDDQLRGLQPVGQPDLAVRLHGDEDRKSTRLNSSHRCISYAVFCLLPPPPSSTLFPYTTLFRSPPAGRTGAAGSPDRPSARTRTTAPALRW